MESKKFAIIVAGGSGSRMNSDTPKQFLTVGKHSIIAYTISKFLQSDEQLQVIVVIPKAHELLWLQLPNEIVEHSRVTKTYGGETRYQSVTIGLSCIDAKEGDLVAIHDAVRPLISEDLINRCYSAAQEFGNAIPATPIVETLRKITESDSEWVNRADFRSVQTPQTFLYEIIKDAYHQPFSDTFTDDASVVEALGMKVNLVEGERNNIKITTQEDLKLARLLIES